MNGEHIFDLEAYKARIGFQGALEPNLKTLRILAEKHISTVPFENLSVLLKQPVDVTPAGLEQKIVFQNRGGYCFEQNGLMLGILAQIGFKVTPLSGRVRLESPRDFLPPRTHLFISVAIEGEDWIFDAGVGGFSLTSPIRRILDIEQETLHETQRIVFEKGKYFHQAWTGSAWIDVYEFTGETMAPIDREVANWWTSTNPNAKFSHNLFAARAVENGHRIAILNNRFLRRHKAQVVDQTEITSADHLLDILATQFNLHFPPGTRFGEGPKPWPTV